MLQNSKYLHTKNVGLFAKKSVEFKQFIFPLKDIDLMQFTVITQIQIKHKKSSWKMIMKRHLTNCSGIYIKTQRVDATTAAAAF